MERPRPAADKLTAAVAENIGGVFDAKVKYHDEDTVSIILLVDVSGQERRARQIGDDAVRAVKRMVEGGVGSTFGAGAWEYIVVIYEVDDQNDPLVAGAKRADETFLDWDVWPAKGTAPTTRTASTAQAPRQVTNKLAQEFGCQWIMDTYRPMAALGRDLAIQHVATSMMLKRNDPGWWVGSGDAAAALRACES